MQREIVLLEEPKGREDMGNNFVKIRWVMGEDSKSEVTKISEVSPMCRERRKPWKFKKKKLKHLLVLILMNN